MTEPIDETLRNIGISPRERLERIETMLERIDGKLDSKADASEVVALNVRLSVLEASVIEHHALILHDRGKDWVTNLESEVDNLHREHNRIKTRMAYFAGVAATVVVVAEIIFGHFMGT